MQILIAIVAVLALALGIYSALNIQHYPTHLHQNTRLHLLEKYVKSRCTRETVQNACLELADHPQPDTDMQSIWSKP